VDSLITVTKPYIPSKQRLWKYIESALDRRWITNDGPLVRELSERLEDYLGVDNLLLVGNGTLGLLVLLRFLAGREVYTTPFSFPATTSSLLFSGLQPRFGDVCDKSFNLRPPEDDRALEGVLATHVFGNPCDVERFAELREARNSPILYDAAHAFAVKVNGESVLNFGDASVLSFHATKLFHCVEGGAIRFSDPDQFEQAKEMINFGFDSEGKIRRVGINAKMNELEAAMGLAVLDDIDGILEAYRQRYELYDELLRPELQRQYIEAGVEHNYSYFPLCFPDPGLVDRIVQDLAAQGIHARRYFSPSLDEVAAYGEHPESATSRSIASRILCLPMYSDLPEASIRETCALINELLEDAR